MSAIDKQDLTLFATGTPATSSHCKGLPVAQGGTSGGTVPEQLAFDFPVPTAPMELEHRRNTRKPRGIRVSVDCSTVPAKPLQQVALFDGIEEPEVQP
jgi:hypothetical protein